MADIKYNESNSEDRLRQIELEWSKIKGNIAVLKWLFGSGFIITIAISSTLTFNQYNIENLSKSEAIQEKINHALDNQHTVFLSASRLWLDTGIEVKKGEVIKFRISGGVNTSVDNLMLDVTEQNPLKYAWKHFPKDTSIGHLSLRMKKKSLNNQFNHDSYGNIRVYIAKGHYDKPILSKLDSHDFKNLISFDSMEQPWIKQDYRVTAQRDGIIFLMISDNQLGDKQNFINKKSKRHKKAYQ